MNTHKTDKHSKQQGTDAQMRNASHNRFGKRLAYRFWWGWSTELKSSLKS